jgi:DNA-binding response OmpR family regulator
MSAQNPVRSGAGGLRSVLVVEDDPELRRFVVTALRLGGYAVRVAADGDEAITLATEAPPDLVLLDLRLRRVDGWQVLAFFKAGARLQTVPVVVLTASAGQLERERARTSGAADYLVKPIGAGDLLDTVERLLRATGG